MKIKKAATLALVGALAASTFVGCGSKEKKAASDNTVTWYMCKSCENVSSKDTVLKEANRVLGESLGLTLDLRMVDMGNYQQKMNVILSSREEFDIAFIQQPDQFYKNAKDGSFVELTDELLEKYAPNILSSLEDYMWKLGSVEGKVYGIKGEMPLALHPSLVFKKDLVEKYNFDYKSVKTLADLEPFLEQIKKNEPNIYPLLRQAPDRSDLRYTDRDFAGTVFDEEQGKYLCELDVDEIVENYRVRNDFYKKGYMPKDANTRTEYMTECKSGNYAVMCNTGYYTEDGSKTTAAYGFPCVETSMGLKVVTTKSGGMNCISTTSKKPEKALQLLNEVWKDDYLLNTLAYGVEGVDYTVDEERSAEIGSKSVIVNSGAMQTWGIWHNWLGPLWTQWDSGWNRVEALAEMRELNKESTISDVFGFKFNSDKVKSEYAKVSSIREKYSTIFSAGCMENFDEYLADARKQLADAGIDKVLAELNAQFAEWKKANANG